MNAIEIPPPKPLTFSLLRQLADGEFHSGETLARKFGVSRTSVNNALHDVGQYGLTLYSVRGRGYRLVDAPQWLELEKIRVALKTPEIFQIEILDSLPSTNTELLRRAAQGAASGSVLAAEWQSAGRGRFGRAWHAGLGHALTFSLLWRFESGLSALSGLSLGVGVALVRALRGLGVAGVGLKWPNDVVMGVPAPLTPTLSHKRERGQTNRCAELAFPVQGKLAGILLEAQGDMLGPSAVVLGVGLNLHLPSTVMQRIDQSASALVQVSTQLPERNGLLALLLQELADMLEAFATQGFVALQAEWESYHLYQHRSVRMLLPDGKQIAGVVRGVTGAGALRVETEQGVQVFNAGEISLREA